MQLQKRFPNDLVVITLNVDFDDDGGKPSARLLDRVAKTLTEANVACVNYVASTPMEDILSELEFFGLPAALLYDREGDVV